MVSDKREMIMAAARLTMQAGGYNRLSFRELAKKVGIRSASIHYHFPTKGDLGAALARRYTEDAALEELWAEFRDPTCLRKYTDLSVSPWKTTIACAYAESWPPNMTPCPKR
jgi:TetR/AcrR family transcriptional regulator, transcriptional repressor for nem operon